MSSTHEEADTVTINHGVEVGSNGMNVQIHSHYTDVQPLAIRRTPRIDDQSAAIMDTAKYGAMSPDSLYMTRLARIYQEL